MRILFVSGTYSNYYAIDDVIRRLLQRGHDVRLILGMEKKITISDDALQKSINELPGLVVEPLRTRKFLKRFTRDLRELLNYAHVLKNEEIRRWDVAKWSRFLPPVLWRLANSSRGKRLLKTPRVRSWLRVIEQKIPSDGGIRKHIQKHQPDIVIVMPLINPNSKENEYLRAAQSLGIPVVYSMVSWDNISSKGTFHGLPDHSIVWNEPLAEELTHLHGIPRRTIHITGAPRFEQLLSKTNGHLVSRSEFCKQAGLNANKPYILYVGSTFLVNAEYKKDLNEGAIILEIAAAMEKNPHTKNFNILVRPHPANSSFVESLLGQGRNNIFVYPRSGELPDTEEKRARYYNSIYHSIAVAGVNTTAFLESSALDKPCITVQTPEFGETQMLPHFHHLVEADFLEIAHSAQGLAEIVRKISTGVDSRSAQRREFVRNFLRPRGISAVDAYIETIEKINGC